MIESKKKEVRNEKEKAKRNEFNRTVGLLRDVKVRVVAVV